MLLEGTKSGSNAHKQLINIVFTAGQKGTNANTESIRGSIHGLTKSITTTTDNNDNEASLLTVTDANSAWVKPDLTLKESYIQALSTYYDAQASQLTGAEVVNDWVAKHTGNKITSIIDEDAAAKSVLVLVNAIYFKGFWESSFKKADTAPYPFTLPDGTQMDVPMMYLHLKKGESVKGAWFKAPVEVEDSKTKASVPCIAAKLAYKGGAYSAVLAMPEGPIQDPIAGKPLTLEHGEDYLVALAACRAAVVNGLAPQGGTKNTGLGWKTLGDAKMQAASIYLPRFEVEVGCSLSGALKSVGLEGLFRPGDFTEIADVEAGGGEIAVSDVVHKVYVKVDEEGTEAAAATAVMMVRMAMMQPPPELLLRLDRPFVFVVVHEESGLALFTGEVYTPEKWKASL